MGLFILLLVAGGVSALCHMRIRNYLVAAFLAATLATAAFLLLCRILDGHWDALIFIAAIVGFAYSLATALLAGIPFAIHRRRHAAHRPTGLCHRCGYSLFGNQSGICPECGTPIG